MSESLHALSGAYVIDALDDIERATFEKHLPACHDCQQEVASLREATELLGHIVALTPPASLRKTVLASVTTIRPLAPEIGPQGRSTTKPARSSRQGGLAKVVPLRRRARVAGLVAAAAAVVAVGAGAVYHPWQDDNPSAGYFSASDRVLNALDAQKLSTSFKDGSTATVYTSASEGKAVLLTRDMVAPPRGKAFEVWLRDRSGVMRPAGMMRSGGDNKVLLKGNSTTATGVGITVEPTEGSTTPSSQPIVMFELGRA